MHRNHGWIEFETLLFVGNIIGGLLSFLGLFLTAFMGIFLIRLLSKKVFSTWQPEDQLKTFGLSRFAEGVSILFGGILLTEFDNIQVRIGDSIAVFNALFWAFHIVFISRFLRIFNYPITIACLQCLIASIFALVPAFVFESVKFSNMVLDGKEMLYAGVLSSGVAFLLQIYGQQNLSPAPVAIIFSLEGVFASIFGWIILNQFLNEIKIIGIILILFAVIFSQLAPLYDKKKYGRV